MKNKYIRTILLVLITMVCDLSIAQDNMTFSLVRDDSDLNTDDVVIIVNKAYSVAMSKEKKTNSSIASTPITIDGDNVIANEDVLLFYLKGTKNARKFYTGSQYLATNKKGSLFLETDPNYSNTKVTIDENTAEAEIKFNGSELGKIGYNSSANAQSFKCYTGSLPGNGEVYIYKYQDTATKTSISLYGNTDTANSATISENINKTIDEVTLNRTFVGDGGWYTLCLPFALTAEEISQQLQGAEIQEFYSVTENSDNSRALSFRKVTETSAGKPYMMRPKEGTEIDSPVFYNKTIEVSEPVATTYSLALDDTKQYTFVGIFDPKAFDGDVSIRFIGADGMQLLRPSNDGTSLKPLRAYFQLPNDEASAKVNIDEGTTNSITAVETDSHSHKGVYDITGRYIGETSDCLERGIYIVDGKKILVK